MLYYCELKALDLIFVIENAMFEENLNLIEMQSNTQSNAPTQLPAQTQIQETSQENEPSAIAPKKRGRKKKETLPKALERSPDATKIQNLRRSQRSKK